MKSVSLFDGFIFDYVDGSFKSGIISMVKERSIPLDALTNREFCKKETYYCVICNQKSENVSLCLSCSDIRFDLIQEKPIGEILIRYCGKVMAMPVHAYYDSALIVSGLYELAEFSIMTSILRSYDEIYDIQMNNVKEGVKCSCGQGYAIRRQFNCLECLPEMRAFVECLCRAHMLLRSALNNDISVLIVRNVIGIYEAIET